MSLGSFFKKQFIDVIHWTEDAPGVLQWRFPMQDMEIQNGAQLTVRESQMAVFVNEGVFADIFSPGPLHAEHEDAAAAHEPAQLGQALSVAVQVRRLLLLHPPADEPAVGHADADHDPRQGFRHRAAAREWALLVSPHRPGRLPSESRGDAGSIHDGRARAASPQHDRRQSLRRVRAERRAVPRHGREHRRILEGHARAGHADVRRLRARRSTASRSKACRCPKSCRSGSMSESA